LRTTPVISTRTSAALFGALLLATPRARADYPIASHRYLADPASLVHDGRLYLYASNDDDNDSDDGYEMRSIVCISTDDLKNWTDHGEALRVPTGAPWASMSWAPAMIERNGTIFMYFGNNANGIGVVSSTSPTGPFEDPRGSALVTSSTPSASGTNMWLFDPGVFVDDDGQAYLYFGGNAENNARVILLNDDMISVEGSAIQLTIPYFYEASWMHKRNGVYYLSYSTNPDNGLRIDYLTSSSPTSGFTQRGTAGPQPPHNENNNHAAIFEWDGVWYHAYHNRFVAMENGDPPGYKRNLALETLTYAEDDTIDEVVYTTDGLTQLKPLNPYTRVEAETFAAQGGVETEPCSAGGMNLTALDEGDWVRVRGVDFGGGAMSFNASVASDGPGGSIELRVGSATGNLVGTCEVPPTGGDQTWSTVTCDVSGASGETDVYLTFAGSGSALFNVDYWEFTPRADGGAGGAGGASGGVGGNPGGSAGAAGSAGEATGGVAGVGGSSGNAGTSGSAAGGAGALAGAGAGGTSAGTSAAGTPSTGGAGGGGVAGSVSNAGGTAGTSGAGVTPASEADSGCGCRTAPSSKRSAWAGLVALLALGLVRRSTRRARGD
jgi:arabinoxylan arabinofuranohydrolase